MQVVNGDEEEGAVDGSILTCGGFFFVFCVRECFA